MLYTWHSSLLHPDMVVGDIFTVHVWNFDLKARVPLVSYCRNVYHKFFLCHQMTTLAAGSVTPKKLNAIWGCRTRTCKVTDSHLSPRSFAEHTGHLILTPKSYNNHLQTTLQLSWYDFQKYKPLNMSPSCHCWIADVEQPHSGVSVCWPFHLSQHPTLGLLSHLSHWWSPYHHIEDITLNLCDLLVPERKKKRINIQTYLPYSSMSSRSSSHVEVFKRNTAATWNSNMTQKDRNGGWREEPQCTGTRSIAHTNVSQGNAKIHGNTFYAKTLA
jgi:hypothetical protein